VGFSYTVAVRIFASTQGSIWWEMNIYLLMSS